MKVTTDACVFGAYVARHLAEMKPKTILDIGSGTGLLGLMLAQVSSANIHAVELDEAAYQQSSQNFSQSPWAERLFVHWDDIRTWKNESRFDFIISNPPFFEKHLRSPSSSRNSAMHDDTLTLPDLMDQIEQRINRNGFGAVLLPYVRTVEMNNFLERKELFCFRKLDIKQSPAHEYFRTVFLFQQGVRQAQVEDTLIIRNEQGIYTPEFVELLRGYYLYL